MPENGQPKTKLPKGMPKELVDFVRCRADGVELAEGELDWLPKPKGQAAKLIPDTPPSVSFTPNSDGGIDVFAGWGPIGFTVTADISDGNLTVTSTNPLLPQSDIDEWLEDLNADLRTNGKQFDEVKLEAGKLKLSKRPIAAAEPETETAVQAPEPEPAVETPEPQAPKVAVGAPDVLGPGAGENTTWFYHHWKGTTVGAGVLALGVAAFFIFGGGTAKEDAPVPPPLAVDQPSTEDPADDDGGTSGESSGTRGDTDEPADEPTPESPADPCEENPLGCLDMGVLPESPTATVTWTDTGCSVTPESATGELALRPGSTGVTFPLPGDGPQSAIRTGNGDVEGRGFGGGTITRDGVTTGRTTILEITDRRDNGIAGTLQSLSGPVNADTGEVDLSQAGCSAGGGFDLVLDPTDWAGLLALPMTEEPPISLTGFACVTTWDDGYPVIHWAVGIDAAIPQPPSPFRTELVARLNSWVTVDAPADEVSIFPNVPPPADGFWVMDPNYDGSPAPPALQEVFDTGGSWGQVNFRNANEAAQAAGGDAAEDMTEALDGFAQGDFVDLQMRVANGAFGVVTISQECPWQ